MPLALGQIVLGAPEIPFAEYALLGPPTLAKVHQYVLNRGGDTHPNAALFDPSGCARQDRKEVTLMTSKRPDFTVSSDSGDRWREIGVGFASAMRSPCYSTPCR